MAVSGVPKREKPVWYREPVRWLREDFLEWDLEKLTEDDWDLVDSLLEHAKRNRTSISGFALAPVKVRLEERGFVLEYDTSGGRYPRKFKSRMFVRGKRPAPKAR